MLQPCTVSATEHWRNMLARIVQCGVTTGGCFCAPDVATHRVKLGFPSIRQPTVDVYCICGICRTQLPHVPHWVPRSLGPCRFGRHTGVACPGFRLFAYFHLP